MRHLFVGIKFHVKEMNSMRKIFSLFLVSIIMVSFYFPVAASETESQDGFFTTEELLAIDSQLDTDGDGVIDVVEIVYGLDRYCVDSDGDGVSDYIEFYVTHTDCLVADGDIDSDNDGVTNVEEVFYGTDLADVDTDRDGVSDGQEINVQDTDPLTAEPNRIATVESSYSATSTNQYSGTLYSYYDALGRYVNSSISFNFDFDWFAGSATAYKQDLAVISSLLSAIAYNKNYMNVSGAVSVTVPSQYPTTAVTRMMNGLGFDYCDSYSLTTSVYQDNHLSQMFVAHKEVTLGGVDKNLVCVIIRGTNGTLEEWSSNFDIGSTAASNNEWTVSVNHRGFDITANRLNTLLSEYIEENCDASLETVFWITGHSRGGALANVLAAKRVDSGSKVFAYTFASPSTTTKSTATTASKYKCIFNILNLDDYVPDLPLEAWSFRRYGEDKFGSINKSYLNAWETLTGLDYNCDQLGKDSVIETLADIASDRNNCYEYHSGIDGYYVSPFYVTSSAASAAARGEVSTYPSNTVGTYKWLITASAEYYGFAMYHQPAFFMQVLAAKMGGEISEAEFAAIEIPAYLVDARRAIISAALGGMDHPHYIESYYLLAANIS